MAVEYVVDRFGREVRAALLATGLVPAELIEVAEPNPAIPADLTFPTFRLARELGRQSAEVARDVAGAIRVDPGSLIGQATAVGPYVNVSVNPGVFAAAVL